MLKTTACGLVAFNGRGTSVVPASYVNIEAANYSVFLICEISMLNVGPEIVKPSQSATFPTSLQTWEHHIHNHTHEISLKIYIKTCFHFTKLKHFLWNHDDVFKLPAFWGRAIQFPPVPCFSMYSFSFESSSGDQGPLLTLALSQQGALPISLFVFSPAISKPVFDDPNSHFLI